MGISLPLLVQFKPAVCATPVASIQVLQLTSLTFDGSTDGWVNAIDTWGQ